MKSRYIILAISLSIAGIGYLSANPPQKVKANKYGVKESSNVEILADKKMPDGKIHFKCNLVHYDDQYMMFAKIMKNDSSLHIVRSGMKFLLTDGDSVILSPERGAACCSEWADGRWYNTSFKLNNQDVEKLKAANIQSISITYFGGTANREPSPSKEGAIAERLRSIE